MGKKFSEKRRKLCDNGHCTWYFSLKRGNQAREPTVCLPLHSLRVEKLFIQIRENSVVKGIRTGSEESNYLYMQMMQIF